MDFSDEGLLVFMSGIFVVIIILLFLIRYDKKFSQKEID